MTTPSALAFRGADQQQLLTLPALARSQTVATEFVNLTAGMRRCQRLPDVAHPGESAATDMAYFNSRATLRRRKSTRNIAKQDVLAASDVTSR
jgi:hypothetical protein